MKSWILAVAILCVGSAQAQEKSPETYEQARAAAKAKSEAKDFSGAGEAVQSAIRLAKTPVEKSMALLLSGQSYKEQSHNEAAIAEWRQVLEVQGVPAQDAMIARVNIGGALLDMGRNAEARSELTTALSLPQIDDKTRTMVQLGIAGSYDNEKDFERARAAFATVADSARAEPFMRFMAQQSIGETHFKERNFAAARGAWEKLLATPLPMPQLPSALAGGAEARIIDSYTEEKNLEQAARSRQRFVVAHAKRLQPLIDAKQWAQAREHLAAMMILTPPSSVSLGLQVFMGNSYVSEGNFAQGRAEYEKVVAATPAADAPQAEKDAVRTVQQSAQMSIGESYAIEHRFAQARAQFERVLQLPQLDARIKANTEKELAKIPAAP